MKININYDLLDKIAVSKKGYDIKRNIKILSCIEGLSTCVGAIAIASIPESSQNDIILFALKRVMGGVCWVFIYNIIDKIFGVVKKNAEEKLRRFVGSLHMLQLTTNVEMLKEAKLVKKGYKFKLNDKKIPVLKQDKYIKIPIVNGMGERFEETLYQEHIVGTKGYDISVKEPDKEVQVKKVLAKQM